VRLLLLVAHFDRVRAHAKPRDMANAVSKISSKDFRCPSGPYFEASGFHDRTPRLQRHIRHALAASLTSSTLDAPVRGAHNASHFYTHESAAWPKPAKCQARRTHVCRFSPHFCLLLAQGNSPRTSLVSERHGIEFRQVWKIASSSLASFFYCNMWGDLRSEKLLPSQPPTAAMGASAAAAAAASNGGGGGAGGGAAAATPRRPMRVVFPAREPISRFVAASIEVLERLLNRISPGGQRMPDDMYKEPSGPFAPSVLLRSTSWYEPLTQVLNRTFADADERARRMYAIVDGFVDDIECGIVYSAAEHLATQMSFLTSGYNQRATLHFQIRLQNVTSDLESLRTLIDYYPPQGNRSVWKCPLGRENDAANKAKLPIGKEDFVAAFRAHPSLVQRLCTVYIQDYLCLGYPLPLECEGGRELEWASRAGASLAGARHHHSGLAGSPELTLTPTRQQ